MKTNTENAVPVKGYGKSMILVTLLSLLLILLQSCGEDENPEILPVAKFEIEVDPEDPMTVTFLDKSENATTVTWSFGDGKISSERNPLHTYESEGTFIVELIASNDAGESASSTTVEIDDETTVITFDYLKVIPEAEVNTSVVKYYNDGSSNLTLKFFEVQQSPDDARPLILLAPGGGWREYNRVPEIEELATNLAKRGYAAAVVNYTVGQRDGDTWLQSVKDFSVAIKFFKKYATEYKIDPDNIFTGGWSTGAQLAMYAQHLDYSEYESFEQSLIRQILDPAIEKLGFEPSLYQEYAATVKGNLLMMPFAWKEDFLDNAGPTMMIANRNSAFSNNVQIWGDNIFTDGLLHIGPDAMKESFEQLGLIDGQDLELIITDPALESQVEHINYTPLDSSHFDAIASFFQRNL